MMNNFNVKYLFLYTLETGCSDESEDQVFKENKMVGCDGNFDRNTFRTGCSLGWHVATASEYFLLGGKSTRPNKGRFVDVTWDALGKETSLDNHQKYYDSSNSAGWQKLAKRGIDCFWLSIDNQCHLSFMNSDYGKSYGCHCYTNTDAKGVICVKN